MNSLWEVSTHTCMSGEKAFIGISSRPSEEKQSRRPLSGSAFVLTTAGTCPGKVRLRCGRAGKVRCLCHFLGVQAL